MGKEVVETELATTRRPGSRILQGIGKSPEYDGEGLAVVGRQRRGDGCHCIRQRARIHGELWRCLLSPNADSRGLTRIGWFDSPAPLMSGWAWGQHYLENGTTLIEADIGEGKLFLFGPRVTFRGQPHEVLPLFFNGMHYGAARETTLR